MLPELYKQLSTIPSLQISDTNITASFLITLRETSSQPFNNRAASNDKEKNATIHTFDEFCVQKKANLLERLMLNF